MNFDLTGNFFLIISWTEFRIVYNREKNAVGSYIPFNLKVCTPKAISLIVSFGYFPGRLFKTRPSISGTYPLLPLGINSKNFNIFFNIYLHNLSESIFNGKMLSESSELVTTCAPRNACMHLLSDRFTTNLNSDWWLIYRKMVITTLVYLI